jgi:hypothetical protein
MPAHIPATASRPQLHARASTGVRGSQSRFRGQRIEVGERWSPGELGTACRAGGGGEPGAELRLGPSGCSPATSAQPSVAVELPSRPGGGALLALPAHLGIGRRRRAAQPRHRHQPPSRVDVSRGAPPTAGRARPSLAGPPGRRAAQRAPGEAVTAGGFYFGRPPPRRARPAARSSPTALDCAVASDADGLGGHCERRCGPDPILDLDLSAVAGLHSSTADREPGCYGGNPL